METIPVLVLELLHVHSGPTRWGNQLNGNRFTGKDLLPVAGGPTRWGNQLNGNQARQVGDQSLLLEGPTRWGNQLNGNMKYSRVRNFPTTFVAPLAGAIS